MSGVTAGSSVEGASCSAQPGGAVLQQANNCSITDHAMHVKCKTEESELAGHAMGCCAPGHQGGVTIDWISRVRVHRHAGRVLQPPGSWRSLERIAQQAAAVQMLGWCVQCCKCALCSCCAHVAVHGPVVD